MVTKTEEVHHMHNKTHRHKMHNSNANVLTIGSFYVDAGSNFNKTIHFDADDSVLGALMQNFAYNCDVSVWRS